MWVHLVDDSEILITNFSRWRETHLPKKKFVKYILRCIALWYTFYVKYGIYEHKYIRIITKGGKTVCYTLIQYLFSNYNSNHNSAGIDLKCPSIYVLSLVVPSPIRYIRIWITS